MLKYTKAHLSKLEDLITEGGYTVRYERGNFKSGYCILKDTKMVLINNFLPLEDRVNCIFELIKLLPLDEKSLTDKSLKLLQNVRVNPENQPELSFEKSN